MEFDIQHRDTELADNATVATWLEQYSGVTKTCVWNRGVPLRPRTRLELPQSRFRPGCKSSGTAWNRARVV